MLFYFQLEFQTCTARWTLKHALYKQIHYMVMWGMEQSSIDIFLVTNLRQNPSVVEITVELVPRVVTRNYFLYNFIHRKFI